MTKPSPSAPVDPFLASLPDPVRARLSDQQELGRLLGRLWNTATTTWPRVSADASRFFQHVAERVSAAEEPWAALCRLQVADLYLACACLQRETHALQALEDHYLASLGPALRSIDPSPAFADEVKQILREKLLVPKDSTPPRLASYSGEGPLLAWLRVAGLRVALSLRRGKGHPASAGDGLLETPDTAPDPEMALVKEKYGAEFRAALEGAFGELSSRASSVLRFYYVDGLRLEQIAVVYGVNPSSVSRWLSAARESLLVETRRRLAERLHLSGAELDSLTGLVQSRLSLSLSAILPPSAG
jgi:RNA polymerase sigma-70 factor (ECF subfamily)